MTAILSRPPSNRRIDLSAAIRYAAQKRGVSTLRIGIEAVALSIGRGKLSGQGYFLQGAWQPGISWADRRAFLGGRAITALNAALNPALPKGTPSILVDKLACHARFTAAGLPQARILAVAAREAPTTGEDWLRSSAATLEFLNRTDVLPCFGKPVHGRHSLGAVAIMARTEDGRLLLGNGREVDPAALVEEIWRDFDQGYMFQVLVRPHRDLAALFGPVIGSIRIVTVNKGDGPELLYAVQRAPAAGAMVDSSTGKLGTYAAVDLRSGQVIRAQDRRQMGATDLANNALTGARWPGADLPEFSSTVQIALAAHAAFPECGIAGSDLFVSDAGPVISEINVNPDHAAYQTGHARGFLNPEILPRLQAVRARFRNSGPQPRCLPLP